MARVAAVFGELLRIVNARRFHGTEPGLRVPGVGLVRHFGTDVPKYQIDQILIGFLHIRSQLQIRAHITNKL